MFFAGNLAVCGDVWTVILKDSFSFVWDRARRGNESRICQCVFVIWEIFIVLLCGVVNFGSSEVCPVMNHEIITNVPLQFHKNSVSHRWWSNRNKSLIN